MEGQITNDLMSSFCLS